MSTNPPPVKDAMGKIISPGDKIVYSAHSGHAAALRRGVVLEAEMFDDGYMAQGKGTHVPRWKPIIRAEAEEFFMGNWRPLMRVVTLNIPSRIMVVDSDAW